MKKKDIINLINAKNIIKKNYDLLRPIKTSNGYLPEDKWVPFVEKYKNQFDILKNEILEAIKETKTAEAIVDNIECDHEVRLKHCGTFWSEYECIFCGKSVLSSTNFP